MPQLAFNTFAGQLFWLAITFIALYIVVSKVILPRISGVLENRGSLISTELSKAEAFKNQAEKLSAENDKHVTDTSAKARALIEESSNKAKAVVDKKRVELQFRLDDKLAKAEKEIAKIEKESMLAVDKVSAELTSMIVNKLKAA